MPYNFETDYPVKDGVANVIIQHPFDRAWRGLGAYSTVGVRPDLVGGFENGVFFGPDGVHPNAFPAGFGDLFTVARTGPAWYLDASGEVQTAAEDEARTDAHYWDGSAWRRGLEINSAAVQLLHGTDALPTQTEAVTAQAYTLSFRGTGSITLSGAHSATLAGTGENDLVNLTFTPSAGTLTITPSGTVKHPMLEAGLVPTSYIPNTAGSGTVSRAAETLTIASAKLPYSSTAMSIYMRGLMTYAETGTFGSGSGGQGDIVFYLLKADGDNFLEAFLATNNPADLISFTQKATGTRDVATTSFPPDPGYLKPFSIAGRHGATFINGAIFGAAVAANETPTALPGLSAEDLQLFPVGNGFITEFCMWGQDVGDTGVEAASA